MAEKEGIGNTEEQESTYFTCYEDLSVHELMLKDEPRTRAYQIFIETHTELFKDKIIIDVGAGTGILSLFAAKAGAKKVFAVEASNLAKLCNDIVAVNGYSDIVEVIHSTMEDAVLPIDFNSADVVLSEWMGFYLLHEGMLSSVICARDKWLKADGILVPSVAAIHICPVNMGEYVKENFTVWENMYGFNFEPLKQCIRGKSKTQPLIETIDTKQCLSNFEDITHLHLKYVANEDLKMIRRNISFKLTKNSVCHGFAFWFTCQFEGVGNSGDETSVVLDTGPGAPATHWKQIVILLPDALMVNKGESLACNLELQQDRDNGRTYNISIELDDEEEKEEEEEQQVIEIMDDVEAVTDGKVRDLLMKAMKS